MTVKKLNQFPWFVALREQVNNDNVYRTGTLISREYVLTAVNIFDIDIKNDFQALVGATAYELNIANAYPEGKMSFYIQFCKKKLSWLERLSIDIVFISDFLILLLI